jgi:SecD/SecF fusion protein
MLYFSRWKTILIWLIVFFGAAIAAPNVLTDAQLSFLPSWAAHKRVTLGLDLQGGSHIKLKIERADIVKARLEAAVGDVRGKLRDAAIRYTGLAGTGQTVTVKITDPNQIDAAVNALKPVTASGSGSPVTLQRSDDGQLTLQIPDSSIDAGISSALAQSVDVARRRVAELGNDNFFVRADGADRVEVQVLGAVDVERLKNILNQPAQLSFHLIDESMTGQAALNGKWPATSEVLYSLDDPPVPYLVDRAAFATGKNLADVQPNFDPQTQNASVSFRLDADGTKRLAQATQQNVGKHLAIVFDDQVMSAPAISSPILDGAGEISANFSEDGVRDLAVMLRAGALPATLTVVEERTVSPSFGSASLLTAIIGGFIAAILIVGLMIALYRLLGHIATVSLLFNLVLIAAVLTLIGATLTLPGIAGIVLAVSIAVDANVLIFERIREQEKRDQPFADAVENGFSKAFGTIVDANVTILIAALILFYLGSEVIRGFAVTLAVGILTTVFTAFTFTRWIVSAWVRRRRPRHLPKRIRSDIFDRVNIRFLGIRRYVFIASAALSIVTLIAFATVGMNLGIDFTGGSTVELKAKQGNADLADIRSRVEDLNLGEIRASALNDPSSALIRIQSQGGGENAEQSAITLLRGELEGDYDFRRVEVVGPVISGELTKNATLGVLASLAAALVYIWIRFGWPFAVGAIVATLHDVILTFGLFVLTGIEFNIINIAAMLTVVGYSLNDTVVVYDRMRENLRRYRKMPLPILIDASINQTLSRTILTAVTTLLALTALYLFGGEVIRSFTFAMLFGVAVGTFSSIYIAAPVLILFKLRPDSSDREERKKALGTDVKSGKSVV